MSERPEALELALLRVLATKPHDIRFGVPRLSVLRDRMNEYIPPDSGKVEWPEYQRAVWSLVAQQLVFIDMTQPSHTNWKLILTPSGLAATEEGRYVPEATSQYLAKLRSESSTLEAAVFDYAEEASRALIARLYLSSAVMIGVAAEAAFYEVAEAFCNWLASDKERDNLRKQLAARTYVHALSEFQKRLNTKSNELPQSIRDNLNRRVYPYFELLRKYRNDSGHPEGGKPNADEVRALLLTFPLLAEQLSAMKVYFSETRQHGEVKH